jgi:hypothetical protein
MVADVKAHDRRWNLLHWLDAREAEIRSAVIVFSGPGVRLVLQSASNAAAASVGSSRVASDGRWACGGQQSRSGVEKVVAATPVDVAPGLFVEGHHVRRLAAGLGMVKVKAMMVVLSARCPSARREHRVVRDVFLDEGEVGGEGNVDEPERTSTRTAGMTDGSRSASCMRTAASHQTM